MKFALQNKCFALSLLMGLALEFTLSSRACAQPMSTGSGAGTGTGMMGGAARNSTGTGQESGTLGGSTGTGTQSGLGPGSLPSNNLMIPPGPRGGGRAPYPARSDGPIPAGPEIGTTFPDESALLPLNSMMGRDGTGGATDLSIVTDRQLDYARRIPAPGDRSLALSRIASAATFSDQLELADKALQDASAAALQMTPGMVQDQRFISIITALRSLAEAHLRDGRIDVTMPEALRGPNTVGGQDRTTLIRNAERDWQRAAALSQRVVNPTYRNEMMFRVAESLAYGSQTIINEFPRVEGSTGKAASGVNLSYEGLPDRLLQDAADLSSRIDRPVWHDAALVSVASAAAESRQFARALAVARMIPQPEVRTNALLKIAEVQARRGDERGATASYQEAAHAVASIPLDDPRAVLTGVLIDNLISVGRFEDARASVRLYPDSSRRMVALGAIAESQGRRGAADSALEWINREMPEPYRSQLYRRVNNGVVAAIERNRSRDLSTNRER